MTTQRREQVGKWLAQIDGALDAMYQSLGEGEEEDALQDFVEEVTASIVWLKDELGQAPQTAM